MKVPNIDWVVMWKLFHYEFCAIYFGVGTLVRLVFTGRGKPLSPSRRSLYAVFSTTVSALSSTWFPIVPAVLIFIAGRSAGESVLISAPIIAVSLGVETVLVDAMFFRVLWRESPYGRFGALLSINVGNATIALALGLAWAFHRMPYFIAALK